MCLHILFLKGKKAELFVLVFQGTSGFPQLSFGLFDPTTTSYTFQSQIMAIGHFCKRIIVMTSTQPSIPNMSNLSIGRLIVYGTDIHFNEDRLRLFIPFSIRERQNKKPMSFSSLLRISVSQNCFAFPEQWGCWLGMLQIKWIQTLEITLPSFTI